MPCPVRGVVRTKWYYKTSGRVEYDEFYLKESKPIVDKIDRILAEHYGFTDESWTSSSTTTSSTAWAVAGEGVGIDQSLTCFAVESN